MIEPTPRAIDPCDGTHRFQWSLLFSVIGVSVGGLLAALQDTRERAEPVLVELTIRSMQSGLQWAVGAAIMKQHEAAVASWGGENPVRWMQSPPSGYRGDCPAAGGKPLLPGDWCFETRRRELIYRPYHREDLREAAGGRCSELAWRVAPATDAPRAVAGQGLRIVPASSCRWAGEKQVQVS